MNGLYNFAISFTTCSFIVLIISYLFPKGNVKNTATIVLVLFCLITIIGPLKDLKTIELKLPDKQQSNETVELSDSKAAAVKTQIRLLSDKTLKEIGITDYELTLDVSVNDNEIQIEQFQIIIKNEELKDTVRSAIKDKTGIEPEVITFE